MNRLFSIIGLIIIALGACAGVFLGFDQAEIIAVAASFLGSTLILVNAVKNAKAKGNIKPWIIYVTLIGVAVGGCLCAVGGVSESIITTVVGLVVSLVTIIINIAATFSTNKDK